MQFERFHLKCNESQFRDINLALNLTCKLGPKDFRDFRQSSYTRFHRAGLHFSDAGASYSTPSSQAILIETHC